MKLKRVLYFFYYLRKTDKKVLKKFMDYVEREEGISKKKQWVLIFWDVLHYNISVLEFFQFGFLKKEHEEKKEWAGTGTMYEFQLKANPRKERSILDDKRLFFRKYRNFILHQVFTLEEFESDEKLKNDFLKNNEKIVLKEANGKCGSGVFITESVFFQKRDIINYMKEKNFDMVEAFINQHPAIQNLSPSAVNTVRIFTRISDEGNYTILGCRMRISVNCKVDNLAAGNLAAPIDGASGIINGPGVYSDITKTPETVHPITGISIVGFQIPFWAEILEMVKEASLMYPQNKSIGWDVVVTEKGPGLIEGNHDWCKLVWQLPVNKGLKNYLQ